MKKILWVTSTPFSYHRTLLGQQVPTLHTGSWLMAALESIKKQSTIQLHVVTVAKTGTELSGEKDGIYYYVLPYYGKMEYDADSKSAKNSWNKFAEDLKADIVHVWGTETQVSLAASRAFKGSPIIVFMQGFMGVIQKHYYDGLPYPYRIRTIRDFINRRYYKKHALIEKEILNNATAAIIENSWGESQLISINPNLKIYKVQVPIRQIFYDKCWNIADIEPYTIFTNAGGYPVKGHHILFEALAIVKRQYPTVKLYIPGLKIEHYSGIVKRTGYVEYLRRLFRKYHIEDNVEYVGTLTDIGMSNKLCSCNVFVMPSVVEHHSNSLIEALMVGVPCISSCVGETVNHIKNGHNGYLYQSTDASSLAGLIIKCFNEKSLVESLGHAASNAKLERRNNFGESIIKIYFSL